MANGGWRCPKADRRSAQEHEASLSPAPLSPETLLHPSLCNPNWWPEDDLDSPQKRPIWPADDPILPGRYGNLINPPQPPRFPVTAKPSPISSSRQLFSLSNSGVSRRPLTAMMGRSGGLAGGEETPQPHRDPHCYPPIPTTCIGAAGGVVEAEDRDSHESPLRTSPENESELSDPSTLLWCPFTMAGETWDACVAEVDQEFFDLEAKLRAKNGNF